MAQALGFIGRPVAAIIIEPPSHCSMLDVKFDKNLWLIRGYLAEGNSRLPGMVERKKQTARSSTTVASEGQSST